MTQKENHPLVTERPKRYSPTMPTQGWLRCALLPGMFSDELTVVVARSNGAEESHFVPMKDIDQERGRVRVSLSEWKSQIWATLPTPDRVVIPVPRENVVMT